MTNEKILIVDDDPNVLAGYTRQLRKLYTFSTADSGAAGLERVLGEGPFAVVVSDVRMPGMDGITFLKEVRKCAAESVRMVLTGNADMQTCIDAVNEGSVFRFLTKPCSPEAMAQAIQAGLDQYRLVKAERELLDGTVAGSIRLLTDILSLLNPAAFSRGSRIRRYVRHISAQLGVKYAWDYEMAATLCQIGCVGLPPEIMARIKAGRPLTNEQRSQIAHHPTLGGQLLADIPRLQLVALIVEGQNSAQREMIRDVQSQEQAAELGAQILRVAMDLDNLLLRGLPFIEALSTLYNQYGPDYPIVEALMSFEKEQETVVVQTRAAELNNRMIAAEDICNIAGETIVTRGHRITDPVVLYLQSCARENILKEPFLVQVAYNE